jgi:cell division protein FtsI (penicillin-binding protein 3)
VKNGMSDKIAAVLTALGFNYQLENSESQWVKAITHETTIELTKNVVAENTVPDVKGMGARDALYLLEKSGLKVGLTGSGKVVKQSLPAGNPAVRGSFIQIQLN